MKTKEEFLKGKVFFEIFVALSCQAPILYLQTLCFLFSCVISFDLPMVSWWSKSIVPILLMGQLKVGEYNRFSKVTQVVRGNGMQSSKKWHLSLQTLAHGCGALKEASAGRHGTDWAHAFFPCTLHSPVFFCTAFLFDRLYCTSHLKLLLAASGHSSNCFIKF